MRNLKLIIRVLLETEKIKVLKRRKSPTGEADLPNRKVTIPHAETVQKFLVCLHEIGHITNNLSYNKMSKHRCEFLTEKWTIKQAKIYKINKLYPKEFRNYIIGAKRYVVCLCQRENKSIPQYILEWVVSKPSIKHEL